MRPYVYAILSAICFAFQAFFVKLLSGQIPFATMAFYKAFLGLLFFAAVVPSIDKNFLKQKKLDFAEYFVLAFLLALSLLFYYAAVAFSTVSNAVLFNKLHVFFTGILGVYFLKERFTKIEIAAAIIALIAVVVTNPFSADYYFGNSLAIISALLTAAFFVMFRFVERTHSIGSTFWMMVFLTILLSPAPLIFGFGNVLQNLPIVLLFGLISGGLAYLFLTLAAEKIEVEMIAIIELIFNPLTAIGLAVFILNEQLTANLIVGGLLLITAGIIAKRQKLA